MKGVVFRIERFAIHDGPGIRTTVFLKGCPLRCSWCHSPESQSPLPEFMPLADRCLACGSCVAACPQHAIAAPGARGREDLCRLCGSCVRACPTGARTIVGDEMSIDSLMDLVERDRVFYDESRGGVTFSGGEPLMQSAFLEALVEECRARRIHVAVDTSGLGDGDVLDRLRPDLFLFDVKAIEDTLHRAIAGVSNRAILANLGRVARRVQDGPRAGSDPASPGARPETNLVVRFPLVPGVNDADDNIRDIGRVVSSLGISRMDVLPYHRAGVAKYERLGRPYTLASTEPPTAERVQEVVDMLSEYRLTVRVGGV